MKSWKIATVVLATALISGCATKHYGRSPVVTEGEIAGLDCSGINNEVARTHGFIEQIEQESQFDGRSVLSFLGDFGIGNIMEKNAALESANNRLSALEDARRLKGCGGDNIS